MRNNYKYSNKTALFTALVEPHAVAVLFAVLSFLIYFAALMCSHIAVFRVASNLRKELVRHIAKLPLGAAEEFGNDLYITHFAKKPATWIHS